MTDTDPIVFIVDDDDSVRKALTRLIKSVDLNVETFASADDFLKRDSHNGPACLVLDIRMPGLSGLDLQDELVAAGRTVPIIFISAHGNIPLSVRAMKAGAVDFIEKPFEDQTLLDAIYQSLKKDHNTGNSNGYDSSICQKSRRIWCNNYICFEHTGRDPDNPACPVHIHTGSEWRDRCHETLYTFNYYCHGSLAVFRNYFQAL